MQHQRLKSITNKLIIPFLALSIFFSSAVYYLLQQNNLSYASIVDNSSVSQFLSLRPIVNQKKFDLAVFRGIEFRQDKPLDISFYLDTMNSKQVKDKEIKRLISYFLGFLTIPQEKIWVNLSPYEKERIIPDILTNLDVGRDLLIEDYLLKQLTSYLIGANIIQVKRFWREVNNILKERNDLKVNYKIWIIPDKASIYEYSNSSKVNGIKNIAFIREAKLKVMMEDDYLGIQDNHSVKSEYAFDKRNKYNRKIKEAFKKELLPIIENQVNNGPAFAPLRQMYYSLILALYFKEKMKDNISLKYYFDKERINSITFSNINFKNVVYNAYLKGFKQVTCRKTKYDQYYHKGVMKNYLSGGFTANTKESVIKVVKASSEQKVAKDFKGEVEKITPNLSQTIKQLQLSSQEMIKILLSGDDSKIADVYAQIATENNRAHIPILIRTLLNNSTNAKPALDLTIALILSCVKNTKINGRDIFLAFSRNIKDKITGSDFADEIRKLVVDLIELLPEGQLQQLELCFRQYSQEEMFAFCIQAIKGRKVQLANNKFKQNLVEEILKGKEEQIERRTKPDTRAIEIEKIMPQKQKKAVLDIIKKYSSINLVLKNKTYSQEEKINIISQLFEGVEILGNLQKLSLEQIINQKKILFICFALERNFRNFILKGGFLKDENRFRNLLGIRQYKGSLRKDVISLYHQMLIDKSKLRECLKGYNIIKFKRLDEYNPDNHYILRQMVANIAGWYNLFAPLAKEYRIYIDEFLNNISLRYSRAKLPTALKVFAYMQNKLGQECLPYKYYLPFMNFWQEAKTSTITAFREFCNRIFLDRQKRYKGFTLLADLERIIQFLNGENTSSNIEDLGLPLIPISAIQRLSYYQDSYFINGMIKRILLDYNKGKKIYLYKGFRSIILYLLLFDPSIKDLIDKCFKSANSDVIDAFVQQFIKIGMLNLAEQDLNRVYTNISAKKTILEFLILKLKKEYSKKSDKSGSPRPDKSKLKESLDCFKKRMPYLPLNLWQNIIKFLEESEDLFFTPEERKIIQTCLEGQAVSKLETAMKLDFLNNQPLSNSLKLDDFSLAKDNDDDSESNIEIDNDALDEEAMNKALKEFYAEYRFLKPKVLNKIILLIENRLKQSQMAGISLSWLDKVYAYLQFEVSDILVTENMEDLLRKKYVDLKAKGQGLIIDITFINDICQVVRDSADEFSQSSFNIDEFSLEGLTNHILKIIDVLTSDLAKGICYFSQEELKRIILEHLSKLDGVDDYLSKKNIEHYQQKGEQYYVDLFQTINDYLNKNTGFIPGTKIVKNTIAYDINNWQKDTLELLKKLEYDLGGIIYFVKAKVITESQEPLIRLHSLAVFLDKKIALFIKSQDKDLVLRMLRKLKGGVDVLREANDKRKYNRNKVSANVGVLKEKIFRYKRYMQDKSTKLRNGCIDVHRLLDLEKVNQKNYQGLVRAINKLLKNVKICKQISALLVKHRIWRGDSKELAQVLLLIGQIKDCLIRVKRSDEQNYLKNIDKAIIWIDKLLGRNTQYSLEKSDSISLNNGMIKTREMRVIDRPGGISYQSIKVAMPEQNKEYRNDLASQLLDFYSQPKAEVFFDIKLDSYKLIPVNKKQLASIVAI